MRTLSRFRFFATVMLVLSIFTIVRPSFADDDCQITLSQATVDLRTLRKEEAIKSAQGWNKMSEKDVNVSVFCPSSRQMAVFFGGAAGEQGRFKFGTQSGVAMNISQLTLDGQHYSIAKTTNPGSFLPDGSGAESQLIHNHQGIMPITGNTVARGQQLNFTLTVTPLLKDGEFQVTDRTTITNEISMAVIDQ
ncbi:hypothetical protein [Scandinavium manionii]|uniref:hypothetical protein n=1 Tax=Scandinavium manionii TaxID=2926520 RepID=UPI0021662F16|nr:hypothetical protein [Scandinavium manionii]MCS2167441.1 hypothetical protein [Scandinavium manionii]